MFSLVLSEPGKVDVEQMVEFKIIIKNERDEIIDEHQGTGAASKG